MSTTISLPCRSAPRLHELIGLIDLPDLMHNSEQIGPNWPRGSLVLYRRRVSTRTTEVSWAERNLNITIRALASAEDVELAVRFAESCSAAWTVPAVIECSKPFDADRIRDYFVGDWLDRMQESAAFMTRKLAEREREITLPGPERGWYVGPRVLAELDAGDPAQPMHRRMVLAMCRVQWIHETDGYSAASKMGFRRPDGSEGTLAFWDPEKATLLPAVDLIGIYDGVGPILVTHSDAVRITRDRMQWLDERQFLLPRTSGTARLAIIEEARACAVRP